MKIDLNIRPGDLSRKISRLWELSAQKIRAVERGAKPGQGSPVFTVRGRYTARGWTEWTQGFQIGAAILQFDATDEREFLDLGRSRTVRFMAPHVSHAGVHDHGFNNISTYGHLRRLMAEGRIADNEWERHFYELALKLSGATQARRWTPLPGGGGFIYSFNGPHSLFVDTIRSLRALGVAHQLGHVLMGENDQQISLLERLKAHTAATATFSIYYGEGRDAYDERGRVAHEAIFNTNDGRFRCPNSQQGWSPFSTWTRGLAWAMCGFAEQLEFMRVIGDDAITPLLLKAARAVCDFYIERAAAADGIPYWDAGAPELHRLGDWQARPAEPFNAHEPVDSSAAAIAAQGLLRLGAYLKNKRYSQAGLMVLNALLDEPYLSTDARHQGLILHSVYHRPNGWDCIPRGQKVPCGESSMWGDYHAREAALWVQRAAAGRPAPVFYL
ncbi:MAG TPA: glycosyl hydrolase [Verrucomicrobiae bacterium]